MKIIIEGNKDRYQLLASLLEIKRFECGVCGCVFDADNTEYKKWLLNEEFIFCNCPCCNNKVWEQ